MKKLFSILLSGMLCGTLVFGLSACKQKVPDPVTETYTVYAPDGAPALALANLLHENPVSRTSAAPDLSIAFKTTIVQASAIASQVGYEKESENADFCILPVNAASKALGTGERYKLLGTVTNGNMYLISDNEGEYTTENLSDLVGKKVGVVQLANVPGLTFQAVLKRADLAYQKVGLNDPAAADKVNLVPFADASTISKGGNCDCYLCPEPAVSGKMKAGMKLVGDLQELYGGGYPQAVAVVKNSVPSAVIEKFVAALQGVETYLKTAEPSEVVSALEPAYNGFTPTLNANNLTADVIARCSVRFSPAKDCKDKVNAFLAELIAIDASSASTVSDEFYYQAN